MTNCAVVFPGQGSQSVGMLNELQQTQPGVAELMQQASKILDYDLANIMLHGPAEQLNQTAVTQPALLCAGVAVWQSIQTKYDIAPKFFAGHSLGEYTALVCAGVLEFNDAIALVAERGRLMQSAVAEGQGAMAAILGLDDEQVISVCQQSAGDEVVSAANFNSPGQVVIAGNKTAVERAASAAKEAGAKRVIMLAVSVPSHCQLMQPAAEKLQEFMAQIEFKKPTVPVIHNCDVSLQIEPAAIKERLINQLYQPVQWLKTIEYIASQGVDCVIESGPGKVLCGLIRRINKSMNTYPVFDDKTLESLAQL